MDLRRGERVQLLLPAVTPSRVSTRRFRIVHAGVTDQLSDTGRQLANNATKVFSANPFEKCFVLSAAVKPAAKRDMRVKIAKRQSELPRYLHKHFSERSLAMDILMRVEMRRVATHHVSK